MELIFEKYQGTGNDFVMVDNWDGRCDDIQLPVATICDRKFGVGADGLIIIQKHHDCDFEMVYFNADGSQSFCGNGSRCAVRFAKNKGYIENVTRFLSTDGFHEAKIESNQIELLMHDVRDWKQESGHYITNTGSPHYIIYSEDLKSIDINYEARQIRYNPTYKKEGINVNFVSPALESIQMRTYERGVEGETLSCGTGVTAVALMDHIRLGPQLGEFIRKVKTSGGDLSVRFQFDGDKFSNVWLVGPAELVFTGSVHI